MKLKQNLLLLFFLLAGIVIGGVVAMLCADISFLRWLAFGQGIGLGAEQPLVLDLAILRVSFGFSLHITVAQVITVGLAIFLYSKARIR